MCKVSVCCAVYNRFDFLECSLTSLLNQDLDEYEIILVNDGSTDPRVKEYLDALQDPRVKVFHQENSGFVNAIRKAIYFSRGQYIAIHGHGDISHKERLRLQSDFLERNKEFSAVSCGVKNIIISQDLSETTTLNVITHEKSRYIYEDFLKKNYFTHGEVMFRKETYDHVGGYDPRFKYAQDYELWLRMLKVSYFQAINDILYTRNNFLSDGMESNYLKKYEQLVYGSVARELSLNKHLSDLNREHNVLLFKSKIGKAANYLAKASLKEYLHGDKNYAEVLLDISTREKKTFRNRFVNFLITYICKRSKFLHNLTTYLYRLYENK